MTVSKRRGTWGYDFRHEGKRYRKYIYETKGDAINAEDDMRFNLKKGIDLDNSILFTDYFKQWLSINKAHLKEETMKNHISMQKWIEEYFEGKKFKDITRLHYQKFVNYYGIEAVNKHNKKVIGHSKGSVRKLNSLVRSCVSHAMYEGIINKDFTYGVKLNYSLKPKSTDLKYLELDEYKILKDELSKFTSSSAFLMYIMIITGGRYSDVRNLKYEHINEIDSTLFLDGTKNEHAPRTVKIPRKDMTLIMQHLNSKPRNISGYVFHERKSIITVDAVNKRLKEYCEALNIKRVTSHALRHTHCSVLIYEGVDIYYISERLGHKDVMTTQETYAHLLKAGHDKAEEKAIKALETL